jgi:hypothetical protein
MWTFGFQVHGEGNRRTREALDGADDSLGPDMMGHVTDPRQFDQPTMRNILPKPRRSVFGIDDPVARSGDQHGRCSHLPVPWAQGDGGGIEILHVERRRPAMTGTAAQRRRERPNSLDQHGYSKPEPSSG